MDMNRRTLILSAALAALPMAARAQPLAQSAQDRADLARIEVYLNGLRTLKARFLQVAPSGDTSEGVVWLERPGRVRFQYDPPTPLLLVAGRGLVALYDRSLKQTTNYPLSSTPLSILLGENLKLSGDITATGITRLPGQIQVTLVRTANPADGSLTLILAETPLQLRQWSVVDAQRQETRVSLFNAEIGGSLDSSLFDFVDPAISGRSPDSVFVPQSKR
jgi:outer membrane lipoprotein-sorting protein